MMKPREARQRIMNAAEKLFTRRRLHEITLDDVAQAARVGKGTIYRHFRNKDDLFFQVATSGFDELCELLQRKVPEDEPFARQLLDACSQISTFFEHRRQLFRMMQTEEARMRWCQGKLRERWTEKRRKLVAAVGSIISRGVAEGEIRTDIPPEVLAGFLLGMLRTRARALADAPEAMRQLEVLVDLFRRGAGRVTGKMGRAGRTPKS